MKIFKPLSNIHRRPSSKAGACFLSYFYTANEQEHSIKWDGMIFAAAFSSPKNSSMSAVLLMVAIGFAIQVHVGGGSRGVCGTFDVYTSRKSAVMRSSSASSGGIVFSKSGMRVPSDESEYLCTHSRYSTTFSSTADLHKRRRNTR